MRKRKGFVRVGKQAVGRKGGVVRAAVLVLLRPQVGVEEEW